MGQVGCFGRDSAPCARFYLSLPAGTWPLVFSVPAGTWPLVFSVPVGTWPLVFSVPPGVHVVTVGTCGCEYRQVYHLHLHNARNAFDFSLLHISFLIPGNLILASAVLTESITQRCILAQREQYQ